MPEMLSSREPELVGKDKEAVKAMLGFPVKTGFWSKAEPPAGLTPDETASFEDQQLDEIWIYHNGRVHFSTAGNARRVDDNVRNDLPPDTEGPLMA